MRKPDYQRSLRAAGIPATYLIDTEAGEEVLLHEMLKVDGSDVREWFPLYPGRWLSSLQLRVCSPGARGLLADLMALSWQSGSPGVITDPPEDVAAFSRISPEDWQAYVSELAGRGRVRTADTADYEMPENVTLVIPQMLKVGAEQINKRRRRRSAGSLGGRPGKQ